MISQLKLMLRQMTSNDVWKSICYAIYVDIKLQMKSNFYVDNFAAGNLNLLLLAPSII